MKEFYTVSVSLPCVIHLGDSNTHCEREEVLEDWSVELYNDFKSFQGLSEEVEISESERMFDIAAPEAEQSKKRFANSQKIVARFYFSDAMERDSWAFLLKNRLGESSVIRISREQSQDWNAKWKEHFTGASIPPFEVVPSWKENTSHSPFEIRINPSFGFGAGTHPTTQLCLEALAQFQQCKDLKDSRVLDFGAGSGILAVAAAKLGAREVCAVEIDPLALESAKECASLNQVLDRVTFLSDLSEISNEVQPFQLILANILRPTLLEYSKRLHEMLDPNEGVLVLSGILQSDENEIRNCYESLFSKPFHIESKARGEWIQLSFRNLPRAMQNTVDVPPMEEADNFSAA